MSKEDLSPRPTISLGKLIIAGVGALLVYRFVEMADPQLGTVIGQTFSSHAGTGALTCADVDKQYHFVSPAQAGGYRFDGPQTASCAELQGALAAHHSPMAPFEPQIYQADAQAGINAAAEIGVAWHEGQYGTVAGVQRNDENLGAMRWADPSKYPNPHYTNDHGWMDFHAADTNGQATGWIASAQDHAALVNYWVHFDGAWNGAYKHGGDGKVSTIISILSPSADHNNVPGYVGDVDHSMDTYYTESLHYQQMHPGYPQASSIEDPSLVAIPLLSRRG
ncbi:MAG TPA: hypothetical protein VN711_03340 [Candidatus Saccharimonadales bacterium]|nr:hypothetical protein [Candidatus Saccharimonadales bacterium]